MNMVEQPTMPAGDYNVSRSLHIERRSSEHNVKGRTGDVGDGPKRRELGVGGADVEDVEQAPRGKVGTLQCAQGQQCD